MKIVLAPDSFKGSLASAQACEAMARGVRRVFPDAHLVALPLADGGEGTLDALARTAGTRLFTARVRGPLDAEVEARWALLPDGRAIIELAQASGLTLTPPPDRDALCASTFGSGQLIKKALDAGCREFLIGLGGSATTDGGTGLLTALGARFFDGHGVVLPPGGGELRRLKSIDLKFFEPRLQKATFTLLCDVTNPLCGPNGAAFVYGPQKGATPRQVEILDEGLRTLAEVMAATLPTEIQADLHAAPSAGAAGGTAFGLLAFGNTKIRSGIEVVLETLDFEAQIADAALILTGEGAIDAQTLQGKTLAGVCRAAGQHRIPVFGFGGSVNLSGAEMTQLGLQSAFPIVDGVRSLDYCLQNAATLLTNATERTLRLWTPPQAAKPFLNPSSN